MNSTIKNILAVAAGIIGGGIVNMMLVSISGSVIPVPEGVDPTNMESLKATAHLFEPKHFIFPFLGHAVGTLAGAFFAAFLAASHKMTFALAIGVFFLLGGIVAAFIIPAPIWFIALDLIVAYIPMAWLGGKLAGAKQPIASH